MSMNIKTPLAEHGWQPECDDKGNPLTHRIHGEWCHWYAGQIDGRQWSAWIGTDSGSVYLHSGADMTIDSGNRVSFWENVHGRKTG